jgi:tetratricopeptide (TPR) repeat protein
MARKIRIGLIVIGAVTAIYFIIKPYMGIQKAAEQKFFSEDAGQVDTKIKDMKATDRKDADYLFRMAVLYAKNKDFKKAKGYFIETVKKDFSHAGAFNNLGNIALLEGYPGSVGRARDLYINALKAEPNNADYLVSLAYSYFMLNAMEEAMKTTEKALSIEPNNSRALLLRRQMVQ